MNTTDPEIDHSHRAYLDVRGIATLLGLGTRDVKRIMRQKGISHDAFLYHATYCRPIWRRDRFHEIAAAIRTHINQK